MTDTNPKSSSPTRGQPASKVKKASAASVGATVLLLIGYLVASWLGIPLDGFLTSGTQTDGPNLDRPVATQTQGRVDTPLTTDASSGEAAVGAQASSSFQIENVTVHDLRGKVAFHGTVDLTATMRRIDAGERLERFRNDGSTFQNREGRLPDKERGYYKEFVHQTPKLGGPGPQRVVTGKQGEAYYTFDHYKTFQKIR